LICWATNGLAGRSDWFIDGAPFRWSGNWRAALGGASQLNKWMLSIWCWSV